MESSSVKYLARNVEGEDEDIDHFFVCMIKFTC